MLDLELEKAIRKGLNKVSSVNRTRSRMRTFIDKYKSTNKLFFATFTFNEAHYMPNIRSFTDYLRRHDLIYCLYPDYGEDKMRYHLHGFVVLPYKPSLRRKGNYNYCTEIYDLYGFTKFIFVENNISERLLKYNIKYSVKFGVDDLDKKYLRLMTNDRRKK